MAEPSGHGEHVDPGLEAGGPEEVAKGVSGDPLNPELPAGAVDEALGFLYPELRMTNDTLLRRTRSARE